MAFYIYVSHPYIGADRLRAIGDVAEADIIQYHQKKPAPEDSLVLSILKQADAQNWSISALLIDDVEHSDALWEDLQVVSKNLE